MLKVHYSSWQVSSCSPLPYFACKHSFLYFSSSNCHSQKDNPQNTSKKTLNWQWLYLFPVWTGKLGWGNFSRLLSLFNLENRGKVESLQWSGGWTDIHLVPLWSHVASKAKKCENNDPWHSLSIRSTPRGFKYIQTDIHTHTHTRQLVLSKSKFHTRKKTTTIYNLPPRQWDNYENSNL